MEQNLAQEKLELMEQMSILINEQQDMLKRSMDELNRQKEENTTLLKKLNRKEREVEALKNQIDELKEINLRLSHTGSFQMNYGNTSRRMTG